MTELILVKIGGSLITDKTRPETPRPEVIARTASEIAELSRQRPGGLLLGHGSGSFGHVAAERYGVHRGVTAEEQLPGVARTQDLAARLHRRVVSALLESGALPFGIAPSAFMVSEAGRAVEPAVEPVERALGLGLLPVVYGDVVLDRRQGAAICSTEEVLAGLAVGLARWGRPVRRAFWLGVTDGVVDGTGVTLRRIEPDEGAKAIAHAGAARGTDVTGGMRHRLETALELARSGISSWILDGRRPGILARAVAGEEVPGTVVVGASL